MYPFTQTFTIQFNRKTSDFDSIINNACGESPAFRWDLLLSALWYRNAFYLTQEDNRDIASDGAYQYLKDNPIRYYVRDIKAEISIDSKLQHLSCRRRLLHIS